MTRPQAAFAISQALGTTKRDDPAKLWAPVLQNLPLFAGVPTRYVRKIAALSREGRFRVGTAIVKEGERGDDFYLLLEGTASILRSHGLPPITIGPGAYFGEMALIDGGERSATVIAETDVLCLRLSRGPFLKMVRSEPEVALALLRALAGRIRELQARATLAF
jgi:CRP/FNR family transcriptional regulator, cyclic AMP receptor protein